MYELFPWCRRFAKKSTHKPERLAQCDVGFDRSGKIKSDYPYEQTLLNNP